MEAEQLLERAERKATEFNFFGLAGSRESKLEEAAEMCARAGHLLKIDKFCTVFSYSDFQDIMLFLIGKESGDAYSKAAEYALQMDDRDAASNNLVEASKCYKKSSPESMKYFTN